MFTLGLTLYRTLAVPNEYQGAMQGRSTEQRPKTRARCDCLRQTLLFAAVCGLTACGSPTTPTPGGSNSDPWRLEVVCPPTLLIGEPRACAAFEQFQSQPAREVTPAAIWTTSRTDIVTMGPWSLVTGRSVGQADIVAAYQGRQGTTSIQVIAEDAIRVRSAAEQGPFQRGSTATMVLQGYYSVASADTGRLFLLITDQNGTVARSDPSIVARGGGGFALLKTFVIPDTSTEVCRTAILEVGTVTVAQPQPNTVGRCLPVLP